MNINDLVLVVAGTYKGIQGRIVDIASDPSGVYYRLDSINAFIDRNKVIEWDEHWEDIGDDVPEVEFQLDKDVALERHGNWIDIVAKEDIELKAGYNEIPLGVRCKLPHGYELNLLPRSSIYRKYGIMLANNIGIVDDDYNNEIFAFVKTDKDVSIKKGTRLFQFTIKKTLNYNIKYVDKLSSVSNRGLSGSSGC